MKLWVWKLSLPHAIRKMIWAFPRHRLHWDKTRPTTGSWSHHFLLTGSFSFSPLWIQWISPFSPVEGSTRVPTLWGKIRVEAYTPGGNKSHWRWPGEDTWLYHPAPGGISPEGGCVNKVRAAGRRGAGWKVERFVVRGGWTYNRDLADRNRTRSRGISRERGGVTIAWRYGWQVWG